MTELLNEGGPHNCILTFTILAGGSCSLAGTRRLELGGQWQNPPLSRFAPVKVHPGSDPRASTRQSA